ncbi:MAG: hypothetical protein VKK80_13330 [Prochlorothrix sp.]|nr:hypothetical protein [Prochlorothrix sp.]
MDPARSIGPPQPQTQPPLPQQTQRHPPRRKPSLTWLLPHASTAIATVLSPLALLLPTTLSTHLGNTAQAQIIIPPLPSPTNPQSQTLIISPGTNPAANTLIIPPGTSPQNQTLIIPPGTNPAAGIAPGFPTLPASPIPASDPFAAYPYSTPPYPPAADPSQPVPNRCTPHNSRLIGTVTYVGRLPGSPYIVAIPGDNTETLAQVRTCVSDALILQTRRGNYIQVGAFSDRAFAQYLDRVLRSAGLDSRIIYVR